MKKPVYRGLFYLLPFLLFCMGFMPVEKGNGHFPAIPISDTLFPIPLASDKLLFYLQRTTNTNTLVYELNVDKEGKLNLKEPVHVYWIRYQEGGKTAELSYIQRKFAYGIHHVPVNDVNQSFKLNFVSYGKKDIQLARSAKDKRYHAYLQVGTKNIELSRIYVKIEGGGSFWLPNVPYIEVSGRDMATGHFVKERIKP